jgi:NRPS condensation-like uncharacterized protein
MKKKNQDSKYWFRLDTSATIYPALESTETTNIFRIWAELEEEIDAEIVQKALDIIKPRFPYFNVYLRSGIFWHYFEENDNPSIIWADTPNPCERLYPIYNNGFQYLVRIYKNKLSAEFSHMLTDGGGAMEFLKTLITHYLIIKGKLDSVPEGIMDINAEPNPEEYEDAFLKVLEIEKDNLDNSPHQRNLFNTDAVFQMNDRKLPLGVYKIIIGTVSLEDLKKISKSYNCKITELLAALYVEALIYVQHEQVKDPKKYRPIGMEIPVNMRNLYPIRSMRNFSLFLVPRFNPKEINKFEDIITFLKPFMIKHNTREFLLTMVQDNCALTKNKVIKHAPIPLKDFIIRYLSNTQGHAQFSGAISNLGAIRLPKEVEEHVKDMGVLLGPTYHCLTGCGVVGFKDHIHINFGRINKNPMVEKHVFRRLVEMGAQVSIKSN